jgi:hypothetical protein
MRGQAPGRPCLLVTVVSWTRCLHHNRRGSRRAPGARGIWSPMRATGGESCPAARSPGANSPGRSGSEIAPRSASEARQQELATPSIRVRRRLGHFLNRGRLLAARPAGQTDPWTLFDESPPAVSLIQIGAGVKRIQGGASRFAPPGVHAVSLRWIADRTKPSSLRFFSGPGCPAHIRSPAGAPVLDHPVYPPSGRPTESPATRTSAHHGHDLGLRLAPGHSVARSHGAGLRGGRPPRSVRLAGRSGVASALRTVVDRSCEGRVTIFTVTPLWAQGNGAGTLRLGWIDERGSG